MPLCVLSSCCVHLAPHYPTIPTHIPVSNAKNIAVMRDMAHVITFETISSFISSPSTTPKTHPRSSPKMPGFIFSLNLQDWAREIRTAASPSHYEPYTMPRSSISPTLSFGCHGHFSSSLALGLRKWHADVCSALSQKAPVESQHLSLQARQRAHGW